jgi:AcrR family transcriptional regulator
VIISAAAALFAERGYAGTTMTAIAEAAGLKQQSLYYWFRRKEQILQATLAVNRMSLDFSELLAASVDRPALKLYRLLRYDTLQLCLSPLDFNEVEQLATKQPDVFVDFWRDYQRLVDRTGEFLSAGVAEGQLVDVDVQLAAIGLLTFNEGMQKRFRNRTRHSMDGPTPFRYDDYRAVDYAEFVASTSIRSLLDRPDDLHLIRQQAARYDDRLPQGAGDPCDHP